VDPWGATVSTLFQLTPQLAVSDDFAEVMFGSSSSSRYCFSRSSVSLSVPGFGEGRERFPTAGEPGGRSG